MIARCGRVEVTGHLDLDWAGTASLVGPTTLMTNRHVAHGVLLAARRALDVPTGHDDADRLPRPSSAEHAAAGVRDHRGDRHPRAARPRAAARRVRGARRARAARPAGGGGDASRRTSTSATSTWSASRLRRPAQRPGADPAAVHGHLQRQAPAAGQGGRVLDAVLGASSTTARRWAATRARRVVDLETHRSSGCTSAGRYRVGNYAVPLWMLTDDPLMKRAAVNFQ